MRSRLSHSAKLGAGESVTKVESRGISLGAVRAERPVLLVRWALRKLWPMVLLVLVACAAVSRDAAEAWRLLELALGSAVYLAALGAGVGAVAHVCHELGGDRGRSWLLGATLLPELVAPAWPELPTLVRSYAALLDLCLGIGGA